MIQVSWQGRMTTSLPSTDSEVARWVAHDRPEMVRAQTADGTAYRPDAAQVLAFMQAQAHLARCCASSTPPPTGWCPRTQAPC